MEIIKRRKVIDEKPKNKMKNTKQEISNGTSGSKGIFNTFTFNLSYPYLRKEIIIYEQNISEYPL